MNVRSCRPNPRGAVIVFAWLCATATNPLAAQTPVCPPATGAGNPIVLSGQYDNYRDAHNSNETCLYSTAISGGTVTIAEASFSPLPVDTAPSGSLAGYNPIYAQPLYIPNITVQHPASGTCNTCDVVVAVTAYGSIFAYNADNGNLLWSRTGTGGTAGTNWLWADDCSASGIVVGAPSPSTSNYIGPGLPFAGIVSTPVIDTQPPALSGYTATMFLTSLCQTSSGSQEGWLHEIDLTGLSSGADVAGQDISKVQINPTGMNVANQLQRSALLEIKVSGATPNPLIYVAFGANGSENTLSRPYHGWLVGYTIDSTTAALAPTPSLAFNTTPTSCGTGGGIGSQCSGNSGTPACDCLVDIADYQNAPNWGGFGGGIWMSGRGPASRTDSTGLAHTFVGVGNGGFQTGGNSYGTSILDFHLSSSGMPSTPSDYFTPYGGPGDCWVTGTCSPVIQPPLQSSSCANDKQSDGTCNHTFELLNEQDWDMAVSGITLFDSSSAGHLAVTVDKAGYGYLLPQDSMQHFQSGDPGNQFPFIAVDVPCTGIAADCDRVTSLAFYNNTLFLWPFQEVLKSLQFNGSLTATAGTTIYTDGSGMNVTGTGCTGGGSCPCSGGSCFNHSVIPGDWLIASSCTPPECPIITSVASDTAVTVSPAFTPIPASAPVSYSYNGYFINPTRDVSPVASQVGYPGGSLVVTSNGTTTGTAVVWGIYGSTGANPSKESTAGIGFLRAYDVGNLNPGSLTSLWDSGTAGSNPASFKISRFGVPTVAHGTIFVPTYNILNSSVNSSCASTPCLGLLVYQGTS